MKQQEERAPELDGTLRAIVAADRLALSEGEHGKELLQRRLIVFYGYFAALGALGAIATRLRRFPVEIEPERLAWLLNVQSGHALILCAVFAALRFRVRGARLVRALDGFATAATAVTAAITLSIVPFAPAVDVTAVAFFCLFFALRAALVPSHPWLATLIAAVSAIPFTIGLANLYGHAGIADPTAATLAGLRAMAGGVAGVYLVSRTIYGLRRVVERAVQLGQYVVHEKIGEGGMGTVYRASHAMLKRPTAVKLIAPDRCDETSSARFEREVLAASRLSHPNNVAIYDFGRTRGGVFYYAMELLDGADLARVVEREGAQSVVRTLHILRQVTAALAEAHDAGLVHRDVKPANIMLCTRGGVPDFVKVLDFGLVKQISGPALKITAESAMPGTPLYMAPEAILQPESVGPAADVYALGCVAHFLLTGSPPFTGTSVVEVCFAHVHRVPDPVSLQAPEVSSALDALVADCLAKEPQRRPTTHALAARLAALGHG